MQIRIKYKSYLVLFPTFMNYFNINTQFVFIHIAYKQGNSVMDCRSILCIDLLVLIFFTLRVKYNCSRYFNKTYKFIWLIRWFMWNTKFRLIWKISLSWIFNVNNNIPNRKYMHKPNIITRVCISLFIFLFRFSIM